MATSTNNNFSGVTGQPQLQPIHLLQQSSRLVDACAELTKAVAERALTSEEANRAGLPGALTERTSLLPKGKAERAEVAFFNAFKERIAELNIDADNPLFGNYAHAAQQLIEDRARIVLPNGKVGEIKKESIIQDFNRMVFNHIVEVFVSKPLAEITIDAFKQKVAYLNGLFPALAANKEQNLVEIGAKLRQATKVKHNAHEFKKIREVYTSTDVEAKHFKEAIQKVEPKLQAEKTQLEAELKILCGERYADPNSRLYQAYEAFHRAIIEKEKAKAELFVAFHKLASDINDVYGNDEDLIENVQTFLAPGDNGTLNVGYITRLCAEYKTKYAAHFEKKKAYEDLEKRRFEIAGEANQNGRLREVRDALTPAGLDRAARQHMDKVAKFYNELSKTVGDVNKGALSRDLQKIIG